ncbi:hypothetical protein DPEC_G00333470 [Dallia pectoralis]|uniref:Uncharacterized protein n=1 Tax=Dallia pectoralis TaxID=75939 RepID=A0ACC2F6G3_DALPE|nr:hypothetical protein DPEC_G00333470 [Dallia pectoralis]
MRRVNCMHVDIVNNQAGDENRRQREGQNKEKQESMRRKAKRPKSQFMQQSQSPALASNFVWKVEAGESRVKDRKSVHTNLDQSTVTTLELSQRRRGQSD